MDDSSFKKKLDLMEELLPMLRKLDDLSSPRRATSPASSAPTTGPAPKQSALSTETPVALTESQWAILTPLVAAIMACIKSTESTHGEWDMTFNGSSILLRISRRPTPSTETPADGDHGPASPTREVE